MLNEPACRFCRAPLDQLFVDLGMSPLSNAFLKPAAMLQMEPFYPLKVYVCGECLLVQLPAVQPPEAIFADYAYFSSFSDSWLEHARRFADRAIADYGLTTNSKVVEVGSNDGYLLRFFQERSIGVLGVEPAANVAEVARDRGIPTMTRFFGRSAAVDLLASGEMADLLVGNNVLAHVPDIRDFVAGLKMLLKVDGVIAMEFPHLLRLMRENQFDTIYHEHFSYFSLAAVQRIFAAHELVIFRAEEIPTHGGSLRIHAQHSDGPRVVDDSVLAVLREESDAAMDRPEGYRGFGERVDATKRALLRFLIDARNEGKRVAGYGAAAKGNTLLNYCGIRTDLLDYVVDRSPHKQGLFLPGTRIPIHAPEKLAETRPHFVLILPWNLRSEIVEQMRGIAEWGGKFVVAVPQLQVIA